MVEDERRFTREEANAELPELRDRLPRLRESRRTVIRTSERITEAVAADGGGVAGSDWFEAQRSLKAELLYLAERGILLRDPETGLVDFPGEVDGRPCSCAGGSARTRSPGSTSSTPGSPAGSPCDMADGVAHTRPTVVVMGATADEPPPDIDVIADDVELRYAPDAHRSNERSSDAEIVYTWWGGARGPGGRVAARAEARVGRGIERRHQRTAVPRARGERRGRHERARRCRPTDHRDRGRVRGRLREGFRPMFDRQRAHVGDARDGPARREHRGGGRSGADRPVDRPGAPRRRSGCAVAAVGRSARAGDDVFDTIARHRRAARGPRARPTTWSTRCR